MKCPECGFECLPDDIECLACGVDIAAALKNKEKERIRSLEAAERKARYDLEYKKELGLIPDEDVTPAPKEKETKPKKPSCPKCGAERFPGAPDCLRCGVVFEKLKPKEERAKPKVETPSVKDLPESKEIPFPAEDHPKETVTQKTPQAQKTQPPVEAPPKPVPVADPDVKAEDKTDEIDISQLILERDDPAETVQPVETAVPEPAEPTAAALPGDPVASPEPKEPVTPVEPDELKAETEPEEMVSPVEPEESTVETELKEPLSTDVPEESKTDTEPKAPLVTEEPLESNPEMQAVETGAPAEPSEPGAERESAEPSEPSASVEPEEPVVPVEPKVPSEEVAASDSSQSEETAEVTAATEAEPEPPSEPVAPPLEEPENLSGDPDQGPEPMANSMYESPGSDDKTEIIQIDRLPIEKKSPKSQAPVESKEVSKVDLYKKKIMQGLDKSLVVLNKLKDQAVEKAGGKEKSTKIFAVIGVILVLAFATPFGVSYYKNAKVERLKREYAQKLENIRQDFVTNREEISKKIRVMISNKLFDSAEKEIALYDIPTLQQELVPLKNYLQEIQLYEKAKRIPAVEFEQNYRAFSELMDLNPDNETYKAKASFYKNKLAVSEYSLANAYLTSKNKTITDLEKSLASISKALKLYPGSKKFKKTEARLLTEKLLYYEGNDKIAMAVRDDGMGKRLFSGQRKLTIWLKNTGPEVTYINVQFFTMIGKNGKRYTYNDIGRRFKTKLAPGEQTIGELYFRTKTRPKEVIFAHLISGEISRVFP